MPLFRSYFPHYFSIEDIMATQERLPCRFEVDVFRLGFLDPSSDSEDIPSGTALELPFWLARSLSNRSQSIITVNIPRIYKEAYREILKADASVVDLHKLNVYFYEFGSYLSLFNHRDSSEIGSLLLETFKNRFRLIMDWSQNSSGDTGQRSTGGELGLDPTNRLDSLERRLLVSGKAAWLALEAWLSQGGGRPIAPAHMVVNHQKRQLANVATS